MNASSHGAFPTFSGCAGRAREQILALQLLLAGAMRSGGTPGSQVAFPGGRRSATSEWSANSSSTKCKMMINASRPAPGRVEDPLDVLDGEDRLGRSANFPSGQRCAVSPTANYRHRSPGALFPFHNGSRGAAASGSSFFKGRTETDGGSLPAGSGRNADRVRTGRAWQTIATSSSASWRRGSSRPPAC